MCFPVSFQTVCWCGGLRRHRTWSSMFNRDRDHLPPDFLAAHLLVLAVVLGRLPLNFQPPRSFILLFLLLLLHFRLSCFPLASSLLPDITFLEDHLPLLHGGSLQIRARFAVQHKAVTCPQSLWNEARLPPKDHNGSAIVQCGDDRLVDGHDLALGTKLSCIVRPRFHLGPFYSGSLRPLPRPQRYLRSTTLRLRSCACFLSSLLRGALL